MDQGSGHEDVPNEAEPEGQRVDPLPPLQIPAGLDGDGEGEAVGAGGGGKEEAVEAGKGIGEETMAAVAGDHGVPCDDGLGGCVAEGEGGGWEVAEAGVEVEELGGEEDVVEAAGDQEEGVERPGEAESGAREEAEPEVHHVGRMVRSRGGGKGEGSLKQPLCIRIRTVN